MNKLFLIPLALLFVYCSKPHEIKTKKLLDENIIKIDITKSRAYKLSELFDSVEYIRLETENHLLGDVKKIKNVKEHCYIHCNNGVFIFDEFGKFIAKIGSKGDGEGKFKVLTDFLVDTLSNTVEILDRRNQKVIYYNMLGVFLNEWQFNLNVESFSKYDQDIYLFYCSNLINIKNEQDPYRFISVSKRSNQIVSKSLEINEHRSNFISYSDISNFVNYDKSILFTLSACDTIYNINFDGTSPRYLLDFGQNKIPSEFFDREFEDVSHFDRAIEKTSYMGLFNNFLVENDNHIITVARQGKEKHLIIHSKRTGVIHMANKLIDDMLFKNSKVSLDFKIQPKGAFDNQLFTLVEPSVIIDAIDSLKLKISDQEFSTFMSRSTDLARVSKGLTIVDNPILQISRIKSF